MLTNYPTIKYTLDEGAHPPERAHDTDDGADIRCREGRGHELNTQYWADGVKYLEAEEQRQAMPTLFDIESLTA